MQIEVQLTHQPIVRPVMPAGDQGESGAWVEFTGVVRGQEAGQPIVALEYEAYDTMALSEMRRLLAELAERHSCQAAMVIHRTGIVPVGEAALYAAVAARHRAEAFRLLTGFLDRLKQDVPIWKRRGLTQTELKTATIS